MIIILLCIISLIVLFVLESKIKKVGLRFGLISAIFLMITIVSFNLGADIKSNMDQDQCSRSFSILMSKLYQLSDSGQKELLHAQLEMIRNKMPTIMNDEKYIIHLINQMQFVQEEFSKDVRAEETGE